LLHTFPRSAVVFHRYEQVCLDGPGAPRRVDQAIQLGANGLAHHDFLAGPYSFADIAFYMAYVFADRKGALMTEATPRLLAWRDRVGARAPVREVVGPMTDFLASQGRPVPTFLQSR